MKDEKQLNEVQGGGQTILTRQHHPDNDFFNYNIYIYIYIYECNERARKEREREREDYILQRLDVDREEMKIG